MHIKCIFSSYKRDVQLFQCGFFLFIFPDPYFWRRLDLNSTDNKQKEITFIMLYNGEIEPSNLLLSWASINRLSNSSALEPV